MRCAAVTCTNSKRRKKAEEGGNNDFPEKREEENDRMRNNGQVLFVVARHWSVPSVFRAGLKSGPYVERIFQAS